MPETPSSQERITADHVGRLINFVLTDWKSSSDEINFPEEVMFGPAPMKSLKKNIAAGAFESGFSKGEICAVVVDKPFEENLLTKVKYARPSDQSQGYVVFCVFPVNFEEACMEKNQDSKRVTENAMIDVMWKDTEVAAKKLQRDSVKVKGKVGIMHTASKKPIV